MILVENGSRYFPDLNGNFSIMHSEKGLSIARNAGIAASETEFFFPFDCNDWLEPKALEVLLKRYPGKGFVYGSTMLFRNERGSGDQHFYEAKPYDFKEVMKAVYWPNGTLQRKSDWEIIGGYREDLPFLEDWDYWMTAGEKGICGMAIPDTIYWYRQHSGMVFTNKNSAEGAAIRKRIQNLHISIYQGRMPEMCCGNNTNKANRTINTPAPQILVPGGEGTVLIEYVGGNAGDGTFFGPVTRTRYKAGGITRKLYIDERDAITHSGKTPGFLEMQNQGSYLFQLAEEESPVPA